MKNKERERVGGLSGNFSYLYAAPRLNETGEVLRHADLRQFTILPSEIESLGRPLVLGPGQKCQFAEGYPANPDSDLRVRLSPTHQSAVSGYANARPRTTARLPGSVNPPPFGRSGLVDLCARLELPLPLRRVPADDPELTAVRGQPLALVPLLTELRQLVPLVSPRVVNPRGASRVLVLIVAPGNVHPAPNPGDGEERPLRRHRSAHPPLPGREVVHEDVANGVVALRVPPSHHDELSLAPRQLAEDRQPAWEPLDRAEALPGTAHRIEHGDCVDRQAGGLPSIGEGLFREGLHQAGHLAGVSESPAMVVKLIALEELPPFSADTGGDAVGRVWQPAQALEPQFGRQIRDPLSGIEAFHL